MPSWRAWRAWGAWRGGLQMTEIIEISSDHRNPEGLMLESWILEDPGRSWKKNCFWSLRCVRTHKLSKSQAIRFCKHFLLCGLKKHLWLRRVKAIDRRIRIKSLQIHEKTWENNTTSVPFSSFQFLQFLHVRLHLSKMMPRCHFFRQQMLAWCRFGLLRYATLLLLFRLWNILKHVQDWWCRTLIPSEFPF